MKMVSVSILSLSTLLAFAHAAAPTVNDSPKGANYVADFNDGITGSVGFKSASNGSVEVNIDLSNFPSEGGPFLYHVHEARVPSNGSCLATGGHLNPYNGSPNATQANELEVGDLSGRHGSLSGSQAKINYVDDYLSLNPENPAFVGNLSVVVHFHNTTRLACANIEKSSNSSDNSISTASNGGDSLNMPSGIVALAAAAFGFFI